MLTALFTKLFLAVIFGATIGLERASSQKGPVEIGGIRTYSLIALIGALVGVFFANNFASLGILIGSGFLLLLISYYVVGAISSHDFGLTARCR